MNTKIVIKWLVLPFIITCNLFIAINCYLPSKASTIDIHRAQYFQLEAELWSIVENGVDQPSVLSQVLRQHKSFIDNNLTTHNYDENDFFLFESIYEWKVLKDDFLPIQSLFDTFRPILNKNVDNINSLELNDFAETVMQDQEKIVGTLDNIENVMIKQGTYYKVMLVCTLTFFFFSFFF